jgi:hypothetical protein
MGECPQDLGRAAARVRVAAAAMAANRAANRPLPAAHFPVVGPALVL